MTKIRKKIGTIPINDIEQQVQQSTQAAVTQMQQDVSDFIDEETAQYPEIGGAFKFQEDPEGRIEIKTDSEGKVISYRDEDGVVHEIIGMKVGDIKIDQTKSFTTYLNSIFKEHGVNLNAVNHSDAKELHIPEPFCAYINFKGILDVPQAKGVNMKGIMEYLDTNGHYFEKEVIMNAQGNSTMYYPKKNIAIDICNNNGWDDDDTFKLQIGDWVIQDSFHLKAFYTDIFKCLSPVAYKLYDNMAKTLGASCDYAWKRGLVDISKITATSNGAESDKDTKLQFTNGARCFPMGFPCIVYLNGDFYGIYSWQLKKHRDNYNMDKSTATHIHLDGDIWDTSIFDGTVIWTSFEVRNPKSLYDMDGNKYNGDLPSELIDSTSPNYDSSNKNHVRTAKVKKYIQDLSQVKGIIVNAYNTYSQSAKQPEDIAAFKEVYETYLDKDSFIDYLILSDILRNWDGFKGNWQWITYDGVKWFVVPYDLDNTFGYAGSELLPPLSGHIGGGWIFDPIKDVYLQELEGRYALLRKKEILDSVNILSIISNWMARLGNKATFEKEWQKWPESFSNDSMFRLDKWLSESISNMDIVYNYNEN